MRQRSCGGIVWALRWALFLIDWGVRSACCWQLRKCFLLARVMDSCAYLLRSFLERCFASLYSPETSHTAMGIRYIVSDYLLAHRHAGHLPAGVRLKVGAVHLGEGC